MSGQKILQCIPVLQQISGNTASDDCFDRARAWLQECLENHRHCEKSNWISVPRRLVDLNHVDIRVETGFVRLVDTETIREEAKLTTLKYACLSHCWGQSQLITTKVSNLSGYRQGIPFSILPKTFQEAIIVALKLEVSYIWIDSLCIIQDSTADWEEQSEHMAGIYCNAHFTIAASRAKGSQDGCFTVKPSQHIGQEFRVRDTRNESSTSVIVRKPIDHNVLPLLKRGWVFQERFLSKRVIHFTNEEIVWECKERTTCECSHALTAWHSGDSLDSKAAHHSSLRSASPTILDDTWRAMVMKYTKLNLTFERDIFPALSGLAQDTKLSAKRIRGRYLWKSVPWEYCAGMWEHSMPIDLLWRVYGSLSAPRPKEWRAPSWSWASTASAVKYETMGGRHITGATVLKTHIEILDVSCSPLRIADYGELSSAHLELRGRLAAAALYYDSGRVDGPYIEIKGQKGLSPIWDDQVIDGELSVNLGSTVHLLKMATTKSHADGESDEHEPELICLVLNCADQKEMRFARVGFLSAYWPKEKEKWFDEPERTLTII